MLRRILITNLAFIMIIINLLALPIFVNAFEDPDYDWDAVTATNIYSGTDIFNLKAKSAILVEAVTGRVLLKKDENEKLPIASITKVMSMYLFMEAIESGKITMDDEVVVSENAYSFGGSQVYLEPGEVFPVRDMLKAIAIHSANDATVALAEKVWGSEEVFVQKMNERAAEFGMKNTHFLDSTGLTDEGHYSSAYDIAIMARELILKYPEILEFTSIWHDTFRDGKFSLDNTNRLIHFYEGTKGLKTGFTRKAGHCLVANTEKKGLHMISVVLGEPDSNTRFAESRKLLEYGFHNFELRAANRKGDDVGEIEVKKGLQNTVNLLISKDINLLLNIADKDKLTKQVTINENVEAPVKKGQKLGEIVYTVENKLVDKADIVAACDVEKASFLRVFAELVTGWLSLGRA